MGLIRLLQILAHQIERIEPAGREYFQQPASAQDDAASAKAQWRSIADQLRLKLPKLAGFLDEAETDVLAYMTVEGLRNGTPPQ